MNIFSFIKDIISIIVPFISSICTVFIVNYFNEKNMDKQFKNDLLLKNAEAEQKNDELKRKQQNLDKEIILNKISKIQCQNTLTMNYIKEEFEYNEKQIHESYIAELDDFCVLFSKVFCSFPQCASELKEINAICNNIWGNEQNYFSYQKESIQIRNISKQKLIELYNNLNGACEKFISKLNEYKDN